MTPGGEDPEPPGVKKDPTKGTPVGTNDTPGPGPNTNNGVGAQTSTEDKPTNSGNLDTPKDYEEAMEPLTENPGRAGGSNNTPTVTPNPRARVDNGNAGSSNNIDVPTSPPPLAQTSDGQTISSDLTGAWEGPPN